jgi:putative membrane protein
MGSRSFAKEASMSYYWPGPWHMMWGGWGWGFGWIFPLLMLLAMGVFVFLMVRMWSGHDRGAIGSSALRILGERFAKGEISKEEFEEKKLVLGGKP